MYVVNNHSNGVNCVDLKRHVGEFTVRLIKQNQKN